MSAGDRLATGRIGAVLFDLDGTLVDTAPDMVAALLDLQRANGVPPLSYELARSHVSNGAIGLLRLAFPMAGEDERAALHVDYLQRYGSVVCERSRVFEGLQELIDGLEAGDCPWGVVTNKPQHLTDPLMVGLDLAARAACIVSGDTLPQRKPDPAPLLFACEQIGVSPEMTAYVGDAARDIEAGRAAGMPTIAATYGYITAEDNPVEWRADLMAADTLELTNVLLKAVNLAA